MKQPASRNKHSNPAFRALLPLLVNSVLGMLLAGPAVAGQTVAVHDYVVRVDADLATLHIDASFDGIVDSVTARSRNAGNYLSAFRNCADSEIIRMRNRRMILPAGGIRCMSYSVDLRAAAAAQRHNRALADDNRIVSPAYWLWRPEVTGQTEIHVRFALPEGVAVSVPWEPVAGKPHTYRITQSPESGHAPVAFGRFNDYSIDVPGATLRISMMRPTSPVNDDAVLQWLEAAASDVSLAYGKFPSSSPHVIIIPVADSAGRAVQRGRVIRDGGESIELFVNPHKPSQALLADTTATHQFSHLMLPYVGRQQRWISEGFAQYYETVLLARSGAYDDLHAWQLLYEGFERGRLSRPQLSPNEASAGRASDSAMKINWSGAAIALMADVALREHSGGRETLDDVLERLQSCCLPADRVWSGAELFATLDSLSSVPVFMPLYRRYADTSGFPDTRPLFERLGLRIDEGQVRIRRNAALTGIRNAITATAGWSERLAAISR